MGTEEPDGPGHQYRLVVAGALGSTKLRPGSSISPNFVGLLLSGLVLGSDDPGHVRPRNANAEHIPALLKAHLGDAERAFVRAIIWGRFCWYIPRLILERS